MRTIILRTSVLALGLLLAACAGGGRTSLAPTSAPATTAPTSAAVTATPATGTATTAPAGGALVILTTRALGEIVADTDGRILYGFTPDEADGESTCYDQCADAWPPLAATDGFTVGEGLDQSAFATVARTDDAGDQVKFGVYPLYYFAADTGPGQTNGQGVGGKWYVVGTDGELVKD